MRVQVKLICLGFMGLLGLVGCWDAAPKPNTLMATACDLNVASCVLSMANDQRITLSIDPKPIPLLQPLQLEARLAGFTTPPEQIQLVVEGMNMYMGYQRTWLKPTTPAMQANAIFQGTLQIPTCEEQAMRWKVTLLFPPESAIPPAVFFMNTLREP